MRIRSLFYTWLLLIVGRLAGADGYYDSEYFQVFSLSGESMVVTGYLEDYFLCSDPDMCLYKDRYSIKEGVCGDEMNGVSSERGIMAINRANYIRPDSVSRFPVDAILIHCMIVLPPEDECLESLDKRVMEGDILAFLDKDMCERKVSSRDGILIFSDGKRFRLRRDIVNKALKIFYEY